MLAQLPAAADLPGVTDVLARLEQGGFDVVETEVIGEPTVPDAKWQLQIVLGAGEGEPRRYVVWAEATDKLDTIHLEWHFMTEEDVEASKRSHWSVGVSTTFGAVPLEDFHAQARLLAALAPNAVAVVDVAAAWPRPGLWLREVASSSVPPSPDNLYCVHAVYDDDGRDDTVWLHSHGLLRCGSFELEILGVPRGEASTICALLAAAAAQWVEQGPPEPDEPFVIGGGLEMVWLPWEQGIRKVPSRSHGGRADRDEHHSHPSAILFAPGRKRLGLFGSRYKNLSCYLPVLADNPILYVSHMETARMRKLARERLGTFLALHAEYGGDEDWLFLIKLGYAVDDAVEETDREHLWFRVHTAQNGELDATLLNEPYNIARMHEGDRARHSLDLMSDWTIVCEHGRFNPDTVAHLQRQLSSGAEG